MSEKILIIEDDSDTFRQIKESIRLFGIKNEILSAKTALEAELLLKEDSPRVIFCNTILPDKSGFDLARKIRLIKESVALVFIAKNKDYAHIAFEVDAIDYLVQPYSENRLFKCLNKLYLHLERSYKFHEREQQLNPVPLSIKVNRGVQLIDQENISYIYSEKKKTKIIISSQRENNIISITEPLKSVEERLNPNMFIRTHKGYIVNITHVNRIEPSGQTNIIFFKTCNDIAYLSRSFSVSFYRRLNKI